MRDTYSRAFRLVKRAANRDRPKMTNPVHADRLLSLIQVIERTQHSKTEIYRLMQRADGSFPASVHCGKRALWLESEIAAFIQAKADARHAVPANAALRDRMAAAGRKGAPVRSCVRRWD